MDIKTVVIIALVILLVFLLIQSLMRDQGLSSLADASIKQVVKADSLSTGDTPSMNFTYSIWTIFN